MVTSFSEAQSWLEQVEMEPHGWDVVRVNAASAAESTELVRSELPKPEEDRWSDLDWSAPEDEGSSPGGG